MKGSDWSNQSSYNTDDKEQGPYLQCHEVARCQLDLMGPYSTLRSWAAGNAAIREGSKGFCAPARGLWSMQVPHSSLYTCSKAWLCPTCAHPGKPAVLDLSEPAYSRQQQLHETSSKAHSRLGLCLDVFWPCEALPFQHISSLCFMQPGPQAHAGRSTLQTRLQLLPTSTPQTLQGGGKVNMSHPVHVS